MLGLVPKEVHAKDAADTSSQNGDSKKGRFRDAKGAAYCTPFVDSHESEP